MRRVARSGPHLPVLGARPPLSQWRQTPSRPPRVLVVAEDERADETLLQLGRSRVVLAERVDRPGPARRLAMSEDYDAIVLVFPLVHVVAADLCRTLRAAGVATPILLLAESGAVDDILTSLNAGASDFLIKPVPAGRMLERLGTFRRRVINLSSDSCKQVV